MTWLASLIMNWIAREGASDWAQAMKQEFDELERRQMEWALGCVGALVLQDVRANWGFLCAILLSAWLLVFYLGDLIFWLAIYDRQFVTAHFYKLDIFAPVPFAFFLGCWRPHRAASIALIGGLFGHCVCQTFYSIYGLGGSFYSWWFEATAWDTMPAIFGNILTTLIWFAAAWFGGKVRLRTR